MTKTEIVKESGLEVLDAKTKTTTGVTAGLIHVFDTDGWAAAGADAEGPHGTPVVTVAAPAAGQEDCEIIIGGTVMLQKPTGGGTGLSQGQYVKSDGNSKAVHCDLAGADTLEMAVGMVTKDAETTDEEVEVRFFN